MTLPVDDQLKDDTQLSIFTCTKQASYFVLFCGIPLRNIEISAGGTYLSGWPILKEAQSTAGKKREKDNNNSRLPWRLPGGLLS